MNKLITLLIGLMCWNFTNAQNINTATSKISFEISSMGFRTVEGTIQGFKGKVNFNEQNPGSSSFDLCADPETIDTDNEERDAHLKNPDFFDVDKYPTICFKSKKVNKSAEKVFNYIVVGDVTIYDTTKEEKLIFHKDGNMLIGKMTVNRFDYNLGTKEYDGTFMVGDEVEIEIVCELK